MAKIKVYARKDKPQKPPPIPPYMVAPTKPQVVSSLVVEAVASVFHSRMGYVLDEVARRDLRCRPFQRNIHRSSLISMCLVSKSWAETCQRILRRRVVITCVSAMKSFLRSSHQGNYVLELIYVHDTNDIYNIENPNGRSHWLLLADMLAFMPNLRFLCVDVRDDVGLDDDDDENDIGESDMDEDEEPEESESASDSDSASANDREGLEGSSKCPPKEAVLEELEEIEPEESEEDREWDKERGLAIEVDFTGIRVAFRAIGRLSNLTGLVLLADFMVDSSINPKLVRYCPYFIHICEQIPKLSNLTYLRIHGFSSHGIEEGIESFTGGKIVTSQAPFPDVLLGVSPPPSLKTLIIELPSEWIPYNAVMWLVKPQKVYALENLFLKFEAVDTFETLMVLSRRLDTPMPQLRNFRFEFVDDGSMFVLAPAIDKLRGQIATSFLEKMPALRSLHVPPALLGKMPDTLEELTFLYDYTVDEGFDGMDEHPDWFKRDMALVCALRALSLPGLVKEITVAITNDQGCGESPGLDDMEMWLPMAEKHCEEVGIEIRMAEDAVYECRMADFLSHGRIKW